MISWIFLVSDLPNCLMSGNLDSSMPDPEKYRWFFDVNVAKLLICI